MTEKRTDGGTAEEAIEGSESTGGWLSGLWLAAANRYEQYRYLDKADRETLDWHSWGTIISHWSLVVLMVLVAWTGIAKWLGVYTFLETGIWGGYNPAFLVHVWAGIFLAVVAFILYPYYSLIVDGKRALITREQIQEQIVIVLAFLGLASYIPGYKKARRSYDAENEEGIAHHPTQTAFWYVTWLFVGLLTLTGFALWSSLATDPAWWVSALGFMEGWFAYETVLRIHLIATFWVLAAVALHAYFPLMPSNHDMLFSMIHGKLKGWRLEADDRPEQRGTSRTKDSLFRPLAGLARLFGTGPELQDELSGTGATATSESTGEPETEEPTEEQD